MKPGKKAITIITGPMFSGKTTALIDACELEQTQGNPVVLCKPIMDTRYAYAEVVTHSGRRMACEIVRSPENLLEVAGQKPLFIAVDEAQFFENPSLFNMAIRLLVERGHRLMIAGLDYDRDRKPFAWVNLLQVHGATVVRLKSFCTVCGNPAGYTQMLAPSTHRLTLGGREMYEPRCLRCHSSLMHSSA